MTSVTFAPWRSDWQWSIPLIVVTIVFHSYGLGLLSRGLVFLLKHDRNKRLTDGMSVFVIGGSSLCTVFLHGLETSMWAVAYHLLGAFGGDPKQAMLYSLSAMTTLGETNLHLDPGWQLMGPLEALDGWILFGLTAAFLFAVVQKVWLLKQEP